jgi:hypothetical protein
VLALRDGNQIVEVVQLSAPRGETEPDALEGLRIRIRDVLRDKQVSKLALWHYEGSPGGVRINTARPIVRAEGVVLAAAGEAGTEVIEVSANSERRGGGHKNNEALVAALTAGLSGTWDPDGGRAVAASTLT